MKTVEEYIKEKYEFPEYCIDDLADQIQAKRTAFKCGVLFAQRWIAIEEELPPKEKDTDESEIVLIRETQDFGNFFLGWYDYHQKAWFMVYRLHRVKPTHWRPVSFL